MKAMVLKAPCELALDDVPCPKPGPDHVLIRVTNSSICGTDLKIYNGSIPARYPLIMGHELVGEVVEGGVEGKFQPGDRVIIDPILHCRVCLDCQSGRTNLCPKGGLLGRDTNGGFAEYVTVPQTFVFRLPDEIPSRTAPLIQVLTTCLHAQRPVNLLPGESVAVLGLGVTGQMHVQLAKTRGAYPVIGITRSAWKRELAEHLGADITLPGGEEGVRGVLQATNGRGADLIIETTGTIPVIADAISMARLGARLVLFGLTTANEGVLPFYQLYFKELTVLNTRAAKSEDYPPAMELVRRGVVQFDPLVSHVVSLPELGTAVAMLKSGADRCMKIVLEHASL